MVAMLGLKKRLIDLSQSRTCKGADYKKCSVCDKEFYWWSISKHHTLLQTNEKDQAKCTFFYVKILCVRYDIKHYIICQVKIQSFQSR